MADMKYRNRVFRLILILLLLASSGCKRDTEKPNLYSDFFNSLLGNWKGCAIKTPVGPRPYDLHFQRNQQGQLNGIADPGPASDHHWSYQFKGNVLWLQFLSTFRGNKTPVWLSAMASDGPTVRVRSKNSGKLKVEVTIIDNTQNIEIFLHDKPHVSIRLVQADGMNNSVSDCTD